MKLFKPIVPFDKKKKEWLEWSSSVHVCILKMVWASEGVT